MPGSVAARIDAMGARALSNPAARMERWCRSWSCDEAAAALDEALARTGAARGPDVEMTLARMGGFGLGTAPDVGPDLSAYDGLLGGDAA
ncbi:hypothetical protein [Adlercreutzia caecimuris]|uniref:hypothetical protein n=1 Tax=Adlercreutzia caecimuris TaxID=671266 RepID=UPI00272DADDC|nr:hypothetical protein [Adlercreutzia caecimuris]